MSTCIELSDRGAESSVGRGAGLERLFDELFYASSNTRLLATQGEPIYLPTDAGSAFNRIYYVSGHFSSGLHEVAHWCIAGARRRRLVDYGYWYIPDGRSAREQASFEQVEVKPQALEWIFSLASGHPFHLSADNLNGQFDAGARFGKAVAAQRCLYGSEGLPERAAVFRAALFEQYGGRLELESGEL